MLQRIYQLIKKSNAFFFCFVESLHLNICEIYNVIQLLVCCLFAKLITADVLFFWKVFSVIKREVHYRYEIDRLEVIIPLISGIQIMLFPVRARLRTDVGWNVSYRPVLKIHLIGLLHLCYEDSAVRCCTGYVEDYLIIWNGVTQILRRHIVDINNIFIRNHHLQKRQHYQFVAKQPLEHKVHHHISILGVDLRQHFLFRLLFICHKLNVLKLLRQSSTEIAVYRKSIRLFTKISLPHTQEADCYLEICWFFTKNETNFMRL